METQLLKLKYYTVEGDFFIEATHETEFTDLRHIKRELVIKRRRAELPGTKLTMLHIHFETPKKETGLVLVEESKGVNFGDNAKGNVTITGRVSGDINLGKRR